MKQNMGNADRLIRLVVAAVLLLLFFYNVLPAFAGYIALVIGIVFIVTSWFGFCPLYTVLQINTCPGKKQDK